MSRTEIITAIRSVFGKRRVPESGPNLSPEDAALLAEWTEYLHNPPANALEGFKWTEEMERDLEAAKKRNDPGRPIQEIIADIRNGRYRNEGL
jgi:hypothetical protein